MTTSPSSLRAFFTEQIRFLRSSGFRVHTISAPEYHSGGQERRVPMHSIPMLRKISPLSDLNALLRLCVLLRRIRPAVVHTHTPKAGLLGMIAASLTGVEVRIYTINGLVWATQTGWHRLLLQSTEWFACFLATEVLTVSESLRRFVIDNRICPVNKVRILGHGGSHGVDLRRFNPVEANSRGIALRTGLKIPENALVLLFVGRLVREKGIEELAGAWTRLRDEFPAAHLLLCGDAEERDPVKPEILADLNQCPRVHFSRGLPTEIQAYYAAGDICVLPTWREGLPNVALEAAAMKRPIVATTVTGCVDAIQDGVTGLLVEPRNVEALTAALRSLLGDPLLRHRMGESARSFVAERFSERDVCRRLAAEYRRLIGLDDPVLP